MSHINDGLLHAYLDGALHAEDPAEAERVEAHLAVCDDCRARLEKARRLRAEADALLEAATPAELDMPPFETIAARAASRTAAADRSGPDAVTDGASGIAATDDADARADAEAKVPGARRRFALTRTLAWAASIVIALGMGWWARELAYQPGGMPQASMEERDRAQAAPSTLESAAAPAQKAAEAEQAPGAAHQQTPDAGSKQAPIAVEQAKAKTDAAEAANVATQGTGATPARQPSGATGAGQQGVVVVPVPQQPAGLTPVVEEPKTPSETHAGKTEPSAPAPRLPAGAVQPNAAAEMAPPRAADAAWRATTGKAYSMLTLAQAQTWLGGPVYGVEGLEILRLVGSVAPDGARAVITYQRLGKDTLILNQQRPAGADAFTLGTGVGGVTGVIRDGTLIYARTALPPDSLRSLLRRLVPLRH